MRPSQVVRSIHLIARSIEDGHLNRSEAALSIERLSALLDRQAGAGRYRDHVETELPVIRYKHPDGSLQLVKSPDPEDTGEQDIHVLVEGYLVRGERPMGDDPGSPEDVEDITATLDGQPFQLTDQEMERAAEELLRTVRDRGN